MSSFMLVADLLLLRIKALIKAGDLIISLIVKKTMRVFRGEFRFTMGYGRNEHGGSCI